MKQLLILIVFMACALIESPEDYAWIDAEYATEIAADFSLDREDPLMNTDDFSPGPELDVVADDQSRDQDAKIFRF